MVELPELAPYDYYTECDGYILIKNNRPILYTSEISEDTLQLMVYVLNQELSKSWYFEEKVKILMAHDEDRREYQRILENKIHRLKERIRQLEKWLNN